MVFINLEKAYNRVSRGFKVGVNERSPNINIYIYICLIIYNIY